MAVSHLGEGVMAPGLIRLFGREFTGLRLSDDEQLDPMSNNLLALRGQLDELQKKVSSMAGGAQGGSSTDQSATAAAEPAQTPRLARIYGFSYLGTLYKMATPCVLRVFGAGTPVEAGPGSTSGLDVLGVAFNDETFVVGLSMWAADHLDIAIRVDVTVGEFREVLLDPEMSNDGARGDVTGRDSGLVGRDSGLVGRDSGLVGRDSGFVGRGRR